MHVELPKELETYRGKLDSMSSKLLRAFLYEFYARMHDKSSNESHVNPDTHYQPKTSAETLESRDAATKITHETEHESMQLLFSI